MKRDVIKTFGTVLIAANAIIAFLSLTNLFLVAAGAIDVEVPEAEDLRYEYDGENRTLNVDTHFTVRNKGIYDIRHLDISSRLVTDSGFRLVEFNRHDLDIEAGEVRTFPVHVRMDVGTLADREVLRLLVEDGFFELSVKVQADYTMGLTKFTSDESIRYDWTAPLANLSRLLMEGNLSGALEEALGWAGPVVRDWLSGAIVDAAMEEGEWRQVAIGNWADLGYRLWLNETQGAFEVELAGEVVGFQWSVGGSVPLKVVDGIVYLEQEEAGPGVD